MDKNAVICVVSTRPLLWTVILIIKWKVRKVCGLPYYCKLSPSLSVLQSLCKNLLAKPEICAPILFCYGLKNLMYRLHFFLKKLNYHKSDL